MSDRRWKIEIIDKALAGLAPLENPCVLCPRACRVDRSSSRRGVCRTGPSASVSHSLLHFGEEPVLSGTAAAFPQRGAPSRGRAGSGTVFFTGCNLKCLFCQNYQISWELEGREASDGELAEMMLGLQGQGALNINLVSPTHVVLPVLRALRLAFREGLEIPIVYNANGYESLDVVRALEGVIDIYLPDLKYFSPLLSERYSGAPDYFARAADAVREMALQQPVLDLDRTGAARKGLIIRHLVLPGQVEDSLSLLGWIRDSLSPHIGLSLMSQYHPRFRASEEIDRPLSGEEYGKVVEEATRLGFENLFLQPEPFAPDEHLLPDFRREAPFRWK